MKKYSYLAGAAFLAIASSASFGSITLQVVTETINSTLSAAGWVGYDLLLVADGTQSTGISAIDFHNIVTAQPGMPQSNIGISGNISQEWTIKGNGSRLSTPTDQSTVSFDGVDSFFYISPGSQTGTPPSPGTPGSLGYFGAGNGYNPIKDAATEDNNEANGTNPPFTRSPLTDNSTTDYGVGSLMTISGSFALPFTTEMELAFIIVPSSVPTTINGVAVDQPGSLTHGNPTDWAISTVLGGGPVVPEPASVGLVGLGALALLARRRRNV